MTPYYSTNKHELLLHRLVETIGHARHVSEQPAQSVTQHLLWESSVCENQIEKKTRGWINWAGLKQSSWETFLTRDVSSEWMRVNFCDANSSLPLWTNHTQSYSEHQACISSLCFNPSCHRFKIHSTVLIIHQASKVTKPCANHHCCFFPSDRRHRLSVGIRGRTAELDVSEICSGTSFIKYLLESQWEIWRLSRMGVNAARKFNQFPGLI